MLKYLFAQHPPVTLDKFEPPYTCQRYLNPIADKIKCPAPATVIPSLLFWSIMMRGKRRTDKNALVMQIGIPHCESCAAKLSSKDFYSVTTRELVKEVTKQQGRDLPDVREGAVGLRWIRLPNFDIEPPK